MKCDYNAPITPQKQLNGKEEAVKSLTQLTFFGGVGMARYYVYVLACYKRKNGCLHYSNMYVGQTNDLRARFDEHVDNVAEGNTNHYTGRFDFVRRVWYEQVYGSRQDALDLEAELKDMTPPERVNYMKRKGWRELKEKFWRNKEYERYKTKEESGVLDDIISFFK